MELLDEAAEHHFPNAETVIDQPEQLDESATDLSAPDDALNGDELGDEDVQGDDSPAEQLADADQFEELEDEQEDEQPEEKKLKVFISYNQNPNDSVVAQRIYHELREEYDLFLDRETVTIGGDFATSAQEWLSEVDFVIALISEQSLTSHWVRAELEDAFERSKTGGRPIILPVRIAYSGPYSLILRAYIGRFQALHWDNENYSELFEKLRAGLSSRRLPATKPLIAGADIFQIRDSLRARHAETFVEPPQLARANVSFDEKKLLWVTGDAAVRNYVAFGLGARTNNKSFYEITKSRKWSEINNTNISDSTIILRDALPAQHLNQSGAIGEWHSLRAIIERNNIIIATAPEDEFERLTQELLRYQFTDYEHLALAGDPYSEEAKRKIFSLFLDHMYKARDIDDEKFLWASELVKEAEIAPAVGATGGQARAHEKRLREARGKFRENLSKWSPADIERFALNLQLKKLSDVARLLQHNAAIEEEIRSWFMALDDSTRCFVLALSIFPELINDELWDKYKTIVEDLRRFDPDLRLLPFGICRRRAYPYVSQDGPLYFSDERVSDAIREEVGRSYREYFIELTPKLKEWSVPPGRNPKTQEQRNQRKAKIEQTREARTAIARMVGIAARLGLDDLSEILDYWATDSNIQIRKSVAFAFQQTARSPTGLNYALNLLEEWCLDLTSKRPVPWRALAAVDALGDITVTANDPYVTLRALQCLRSFARSRRKDARFYASMALRKVARYAPLSSTEGILRRLAQDERTELRVNVAAALNEARFYNSDEADTLVERWMQSFDPNRRWVALCATVTDRRNQNGANPHRYNRLLQLLEDDAIAESLASVLGETVNDERYGQVAKDSLGFLAEHAREAQWTNFAAGLAIVSISKLDKEILPLLRFSDGPPFEERAVDVRREVLRRKLDSPARFLATLRAWLNGKDTQLELFRALTQLLDDTPGSSRSEVIASMAEQFCAEPASVNETLSALRILAPAHFETVAQGVRNEAFRRSLEDSAGFVALAGAQLAQVETAGDTAEAIVRLARDDPPGSREQMMRALLEADAQAPQMTKNLVFILRTGEPDLVRIVYEFNYRLIEKAMAVPVTFPAFVLETIRTDDDAIGLLNYLAEPEPQGNRSTLVRALVEARLLEANGVDELLALPALKQWTNLASLQAEVARSYYLRRIFAPRFVTKLFSKRSIENW